VAQDVEEHSPSATVRMSVKKMMIYLTLKTSIKNACKYSIGLLKNANIGSLCEECSYANILPSFIALRTPNTITLYALGPVYG